MTTTTIAPRLKEATVAVASPTNAHEVLVEFTRYQMEQLRPGPIADEDVRFFVEEAFNDILMIVDGVERPWIIDSMTWHYSWIPEGGVNAYLEVLLSLEMPIMAEPTDGRVTFNQYLCVRYWPSEAGFEPVQAVVHATSDSEPERSEIIEMLSG